jgi:hypothetical protein
VADTFAVKVNVGLGCDGNAVDFFGGHGFVFLTWEQTLDFRLLRSAQNGGREIHPKTGVFNVRGGHTRPENPSQN